MGPVSFSQIPFPTRDKALEAARRLTDAGIRVQSADSGTALLVRSDDQARADLVLANLAAEQSGAYVVEPLKKPFDATVDIPGSKSHTNRAVLCAALAQGRSTLSRVLLADDTEAMIGAIETLGVGISLERSSPVGATAVVDGGIEDPEKLGDGGGQPIAVDVRQSGTTSRFLLPTLAAIDGGRFVLDGHPQMRARPFGPQLDALRVLGADVAGSSLPLTINGRPLSGGQVVVSGDISSQFLSGLLLAAPLYSQPTEIQVDGDLVSKPYVELTVQTMGAFGIDVNADLEGGRFVVPVGRYQPATLDLEPDASAASYFFAAAAITGSTVRVEGLGRSTIQGDLKFVYLLEQMGAKVAVGERSTEVTGTGQLNGITADMADISDTVQTLAAVAACADGPTEITGVGFIRHKETDRIAAPVAELQRLGVDAEATDDGMIIRPGAVRPATVDTYEDHRMAMSFALLGLVYPGVRIADPGCVAKTFPNFFDVLGSLS